MAKRERTAEDFLPDRWTLPALRRAAAGCQGCELYQHSTQTVFGEGPETADLMLIGEIPGDQEDRQGHPFVGPAGRLLDESLEAVGLSRPDVYVTNVVKHFKWEPRGKRRLHKKPGQREIVACRAWLDAEIQVVQPRLLVCLGATAAQALLGRDFRITRQRGEVLENSGDDPAVLATYHPSAVLRAADSAAREQLKSELTEDLRVGVKWLAQRS